MKKVVVLFVFLLALSINPVSAADIQWVCFSPHGGCTSQIIKTINACRDPVYVAAYSFTSKPIVAALIEKNRSIPVRVVLDRSNRTARGSGLNALRSGGVAVRLDDKHAITHNKYIVCGDTVETGSFNFTNNAEKNNAENALAIRDEPLAQTYRMNWQKLWNESVTR